MGGGLFFLWDRGLFMDNFLDEICGNVGKLVGYFGGIEKDGIWIGKGCWMGVGIGWFGFVVMFFFGLWNVVLIYLNLGYIMWVWLIGFVVLSVCGGVGVLLFVSVV